jgi:hypothetical protein
MKQITLSVFFFLFIFSSCNKDEQIKTLVLEEKFQIDQAFVSSDNSLKFTITEINDSRCPSDVVCVWQGEAVVKIAVESPLAGTLELSTFHNPSDTLGTYIFQILEVTPYPVSTETIELNEYNVKLKVEKL